MNTRTLLGRKNLAVVVVALLSTAAQAGVDIEDTWTRDYVEDAITDTVATVSADAGDVFCATIAANKAPTSVNPLFTATSSDGGAVDAKVESLQAKNGASGGYIYYAVTSAGTFDLDVGQSEGRTVWAVYHLSPNGMDTGVIPVSSNFVSQSNSGTNYDFTNSFTWTGNSSGYVMEAASFYSTMSNTPAGATILLDQASKRFVVYTPFTDVDEHESVWISTLDDPTRAQMLAIGVAFSAIPEPAALGVAALAAAAFASRRRAHRM